jgi:ABC-2 type transport system permease protein
MPPERLRRVWDARQALLLLVRRDLKVRYEGAFLGWIWSVLDPLLMTAVYWFVFTQIFTRSVGYEPYIMFLISAMLPWQWTSGVLNDSPRALTSEAKLVRTINLPRQVWVMRSVTTKAAEYLLSLPVLVIFAVLYRVTPSKYLLLTPLVFALQFVLLLGIAMLFSSITVLVPDMQRLIRVGTRLLFYASPIIYSLSDVSEPMRTIASLNPLAGILELWRAVWFPQEFEQNDLWPLIGISVVVAVVILGIGIVVFGRLERTVLKEI